MMSLKLLVLFCIIVCSNSSSVTPGSFVGNMMRWIIPQSHEGSNRQGRVVGGSDVGLFDRASYAYVARIHVIPVSAFPFISINVCGAAILSSTKLVTSASCFAFMEAFGLSTFKAYAGDLKAYIPELGEFKKSLTYTKYPGYDYTNNPVKNDIAIVSLAYGFFMSSKIAAISLPTSAAGTATLVNYGGYTITTPGYGFTTSITIDSSFNPVSFVTSNMMALLKSRLKTTTQLGLLDADCTAKLLGSSLPPGVDTTIITNSLINLICVIPATANTGPCLFDNGAPYVYNNQLIGVSTIVTNCGGTSYPGFATEISGDIYTWVKSTANI